MVGASVVRMLRQTAAVVTVRDDLATLRECVGGRAYGMPRHREALARVEAEIARLEAEAKHGERAWEQMRERAPVRGTRQAGQRMIELGFGFPFLLIVLVGVLLVDVLAGLIGGKR